KKVTNWCEQTQQLLRCWFNWSCGTEIRKGNFVPNQQGTSHPDENIHETPYYAPTKEAKEGRKLPQKSPARGHAPKMAKRINRSSPPIMLRGIAIMMSL
ncbi:hypothetical protein TorRG33x02_195980, partial [Trema orientale]